MFRFQQSLFFETVSKSSFPIFFTVNVDSMFVFVYHTNDTITLSWNNSGDMTVSSIEWLLQANYNFIDSFIWFLKVTGNYLKDANTTLITQTIYLSSMNMGISCCSLQNMIVHFLTSPFLVLYYFFFFPFVLYIHHFSSFLFSRCFSQSISFYFYSKKYLHLSRFSLNVLIRYFFRYSSCVYINQKSFNRFFFLSPIRTSEVKKFTKVIVKVVRTFRFFPIGTI